MGASDVPPLPEGCAIVAVASPQAAGLEDYTRSGDAIMQCCLEREGVSKAERGAAPARRTRTSLSI